jgi:hypothetical protein
MALLKDELIATNLPLPKAIADQVSERGRVIDVQVAPSELLAPVAEPVATAINLS